MCLDKLEDFKVKLNKDGVGKGYKVFERLNGNLFPLVFQNNSLPREQWLHEKEYRSFPHEGRKAIQLLNGNGSYGFGWHVFKSAKDAYCFCDSCVSYIAKRVLFKNVQATGMWGNDKTIVAKEIFIPNDEKSKKSVKRTNSKVLQGV